MADQLMHTIITGLMQGERNTNDALLANVQAENAELRWRIAAVWDAIDAAAVIDRATRDRLLAALLSRPSLDEEVWA